MLIGRVQGKKSGGKDPVLTELTVTENGVYDEPMISNTPEPITWDGVVDGRPTMQVFDYTVVKVSDTILTADNLSNSTMTSNTGAEYPMPTGLIITVGGAVCALEGAIVSVSDVNVDVSGQLFVFPETGTYFADRIGEEYFQSLTFVGGAPTPADGWNKVTVNVEGAIVDVPELPTEGIVEGNIYRVKSGFDVIYGITSDVTVNRLVDGAWVEMA
jgi:hypothetical protein